MALPALPSTRPNLLLDFVRSNRLDPRITFTRGSSATRVNKSGLIELVGNNAPRFDYDPVTLACKGLLVEEQRSNRLLWSEDFTNVAWVSSNITVTSNAATAPDGATTADRLTATGSNGTELQTITPGAGSQTLSVYMRRHTGSGDIQLTADGSTWTTVAVTAAWTRVSVTHTAPSGAIAVGIRIVVSGDAVEVWGAQHE